MISATIHRSPKTYQFLLPTPRDAVAYIMETFPIVKRKDEAAHSCYRTKDRILEIYDQMQQAMVTGTTYQSPLNPPPGPPTDAEGNFLSYSQISPADYPHIHLSQNADPAKRTVWYLSDLAREFPERPFQLRLGVSADSEVCRVNPTNASELASGDRVVLAAEGLECNSMKTGVAMGELTLTNLIDASTKKPLVLVSVKTTDGLAKVRLPLEDWQKTTTIGRVVD